MPDYVIEPVTPDDADAYVGCHLDCLAETYDEVMPPEFMEQQRRELDATVLATRQRWRELLALSSPPTRSWLARDATGEVVGVVSAGLGQQDWELRLNAPPPPVPYQLNHLYTRRSTHGTGLGPRLLEVALGSRQAYLWILDGNPRADRFYRRHGFAPDGARMNCGPSWFYRPEYRLVRRSNGPAQ
jgi:GNAT superfamily N-acetyltransferase